MNNNPCAGQQRRKSVHFRFQIEKNNRGDLRWGGILSSCGQMCADRNERIETQAVKRIEKLILGKGKLMF